MPADNRIAIHFADFYVTNVCNYSCRNCNRFNEFKFAGHHLWAPHAESYKKLSKKIKFTKIGISGGESFLNPDLNNWIAGVRELWPDVDLWVGTNGSRLKFIKDLYSTMVKYNVGINLVAHTRDKYDEFAELIYSLLQAPVTVQYKCDFSNWVDVYNNIREEGWPDCTSMEEFDNLPPYIKHKCISTKNDPHSVLSQRDTVLYTDCNGVRIAYNHGLTFVTTGLKYTNGNEFEIYDSDPEVSHEICFSKHCHLFHNGKLYKCSNVAILPEFIQQYKVNISEEDKALLLDYKPLTADATEEEVREWYITNRKAIPQCKLCPSKLEYNQVNGPTKKLKIIKINNLSSE